MVAETEVSEIPMTDPSSASTPDERPYMDWALSTTLRGQRKALGLTQEQVADRIGLTRASVTNFESGNQDVPLSKVVAYAELVGMRLVPLPKEFLR